MGRWRSFRYSKIIGGLKFYERKEIKDIIAYLRLIFNTNDNLSLKRIINEPKRGVGKTSLDAIQEVADSNGISMYEVIKNAAQYGLNRVFINTREFIEQIENLIAKKDEIKITHTKRPPIRWPDLSGSDQAA